jgi:hypothetical protein
MSQMKVCTKCGPEVGPQPIENFPWKNRLLGKRHAVCKTCTAERSKKIYEGDKETHIARVRVNTQRYRQTAREYVLEYLSTHPCSNPDCHGGPGGGPETDPAALEFHHVGGKEAEISRLIGRGASAEVIQREIEKCVVLCASCHRKLTAKERGWWKGRGV